MIGRLGTDTEIRGHAVLSASCVVIPVGGRSRSRQNAAPIAVKPKAAQALLCANTLHGTSVQKVTGEVQISAGWLYR